MKNREIFAIASAAFLILAPLYFGETQSFVHGRGLQQTDKILAWLGFVVLVFQAVIYNRQAGIMGEQNKLIKRQLKATEKAADAAIAAQRPWIKVVDLVLEAPLAVNLQNQMVMNGLVCVKNIGNTPALKTWVFSAVCFDFSGINDSLKFLQQQVDQFDSLGLGETIFPGDEFKQNFRSWSTIPELPPAAFVIIVGIVAYKFGTDTGTTTFAFILSRIMWGPHFLRLLRPGDTVQETDIDVQRVGPTANANDAT